MKKVDLTGYVTVKKHYDISTGNIVELMKSSDGYLIHRLAKRGKVDNYVANYEYIDNQDVSHLKPLDLEYGEKIMNRISKGGNYSNVFIFFEEETSLGDIHREKSEEEQEDQQ